eukprot:jgi/Chlat1/2576/Chrsp175S02442
MHFTRAEVLAFTAAALVTIAAVGAAAAFLFGAKKKQSVIHPEKWNRFKLIQLDNVSHNTRRLRFELPTPQAVLGLPVGQHVSLQGTDAQGNEFMKPYTPTTLDKHVGYFDLIYTDGKMSQFVDKLKIGDMVAFRGPKGKYQYRRNMCTHIGMIAGGTGITPMYQVMQAILDDPLDKTQISLIFANVSENDILLKDELDAVAAAHPSQVKIFYTLDKPTEGWKGGVGYVTTNMIKEHMPPPSPTVLRCGPPLMNKMVGSLLDQLGYSSDTLFKF